MKLLAKLKQCQFSPVAAQNLRFSSTMFGSSFSSKDSRTSEEGEGKRILHLNLSHGDKSLVSEGAKTFLSNLKFQHKVDELKMWKDPLEIQYNLTHAMAKMRLLMDESTKEDEELFNPVLRQAKMINDMDIVLISTPMWNYSIPYPLKQYIDTIVQPGINFCDGDQSSLGDLRGRHLVVFSSAGAIYNEDSHVKDFLNPYLCQVFSLMGFERQEIVFIQGTSVRSREELALFTQERALSAARRLNNDICDKYSV